MEEKILTVNASALNKIMGKRPFAALPQEEIDRLYGSIEVEATERAVAENDPRLMRLAAIIALHYNYSWLTCHGGLNQSAKNADGLSMGFAGPMNFDGNNDIFLDERLKSEVNKIVVDNVDIKANYNLRLAGLLCENSGQSTSRYLGLVYIARLRQADAIDKFNGNHGIRFYGMGELQEKRSLFNNWSRILIDHLSAL